MSLHSKFMVYKASFQILFPSLILSFLWRCVLDFEPREGMMMICQSLTNLAEMIAREVVAEEQMNSGEVLLNRAIDTYWDACLYLDVSDKWTIKYCNDAFVTLTGISENCLMSLLAVIWLHTSACDQSSWQILAAELKLFTYATGQIEHAQTPMDCSKLNSHFHLMIKSVQNMKGKVIIRNDFLPSVY